MRTRSTKNSRFAIETIDLISKNLKTIKNENKLLGRKRNKEETKRTVNIKQINKENFLAEKKIAKKEFKISKSEDKFLKILHNTMHETSTTAYTSDDEVFNDHFVDSLMSWPIENSIQAPVPGLKNIGNTCFLNSVLQCILYTIPLKNYLNYSNHTKTCKVKGVCFICEYDRLSKLIGNILYYIYRMQKDCYNPSKYNTKY
jgi:ubiquitin C-terminal hydrolase